MIYQQEDYDKEKELVSGRIAKSALKKGYPSKYLEGITSLMDQYYKLYDFEPNIETLSHPKVKEAFELIEQAHAGQMRKYIDEEYSVHLREVASYISSLPDHSHEEVVAALLHDVVEKGNVSLEEIKEKFGQVVHDHVYYLTDIATPEDGNRETRINKNWEHFSQSSPKTQNIKAIDILSSARTTMLCDAKYGETYMTVIIELMNPYFQKMDSLDPSVKKTMNDMTNLSMDIIKLQKKHDLPKLEKAYSNKLKSLKKMNAKMI